MSVHEILNLLLRHDLPRSIEIFAPELVLCGTIIALLFVRMCGLQRKVPVHVVALLGGLLVFVGVFTQFMYLRVADEQGLLKTLTEMWHLTQAGAGTPGPYFTGLLSHDLFSVFMRLGLSLFLVLLTALTVLSGIPDQEDAQDFYTLLFGATLGMMLAVGANHLLMLFLSVEMMSVPSYALVAFQKGRRQAGEAALKYVVYGAGAAGVMLYGISLIAGLLGTAEMPLLAQRVLLVLDNGGLTQNSAVSVTLLLGILMVLAGLAFKLALVPFHFWCPDAFEGASAEVCAFLSVASKAASFALLVRFVLAFQGTGAALQQLSLIIGLTLGLLAIITTTYGNLAAYTQSNLKRLLAYSTIAQAGYMVMAVSAMLVLLSAPAGVLPNPAAAASQCLEGLMYYLAVYLFMNLAAFACVALIRNEIFSEEIDDYRGLFTGNTVMKFLCVCLTLSFFSLVGVPPLGGAFAKVLIFISTLKAASVHWSMWVVLIVGGLNTVFSLFYYLRVVRAMFMTEPATDRRRLRVPAMLGVYVAMVTLPILALGMSPLMADLTATAQSVARSLLP
ncbi:NADH-quinone oxidoreductase subunit N [Planctomicrobium piriforme]|uniref:NADH-quinone oxidoreductase subunit N n=1 Tax=Planctomicrobium piriforme TaxID=1576369 RepID=A0A1I3G1N5_9PLAN|nr:NADH-quinone oxidoreductase subunit N [Planctomicrobium piriforme]SFI17327.1 NADH-quinone oxidoreductase subunit N [Planctomicrobium piriforme]